MTAYYNENNPEAAAWLRELIRAGLIAPGHVDDRSIEDVKPADLDGFTQCHFFAGIGIWSHALRSAGWTDDRPVWTGSCPCQPFSAAGKGNGFADERHLWPAFYHLIVQCRPGTVFGEQVASKDGLAWLDLVAADLEGAGYACGAVDSCAAGFGAPHIRQRLYWVADSGDDGREQGGGGTVLRPLDKVCGSAQVKRGEQALPPERGCGLCGMADAPGARHIGALGGTEGEARDEARLRLLGAKRGFGELADADRRQRGGIASGEGCINHGPQAGREQGDSELERRCEGRGLADAESAGRQYPAKQERRGYDEGRGINGDPSPTDGFWRDADWLLCRDGVWRPVEPGTFPLAHGAPARVGRLRGYGNAIVAPQAEAFVKAYMETIGLQTSEVR